MSLEFLAKSFAELRDDFDLKYGHIVRTVEPEKIAPLIRTNFATSELIWDDALSVLGANQFYAVSLVGPQGSGKTTIAEEFAKRALKQDFNIIYAKPEDFLPDVNKWIERIIAGGARAKNYLVLDDISYYFDTQPRKAQSLVKNIVARFRHVFGGQLFVFYITHRLHAAPPMLRNAGTWIFASMQPADRQDAEEVIGKTKEMRDRLQALYVFISRCTIEGPKKRLIKFSLNDAEFLFKWGIKDDVGDGRLMVCFHAGRLDVYNSKVSDTNATFDFEDYRFTKEEKNVF